MKILYATDGSKGGLNPALFFVGLPHRQDVHIHLMTVLAFDDEQDGSAILAPAKAALNGFPGQVTMATTRGSGSTSGIVDAILCAADDVDADFIAVGASGHSAVARFFMGSVAERVARYARHPVLVARPLASPLRDVIVGVDGSDYGVAAAEFVTGHFPLPPICAVRLASAVAFSIFSATGHLLYPDTDVAVLEAASQEERNKARDNAEALAQTLRRLEGGRQIEVESAAVGEPATELVRRAEEQSAGLIVVGSQGRDGVERFLLGSVSERVMRHAACSVLIVKGRQVKPGDAR